MKSKDFYKTLTSLTNANLKHANLKGASLAHADLKGVSLRGTKLTGANVIHTCLVDSESGSEDIVRWKKIREEAQREAQEFLSQVEKLIDGAEERLEKSVAIANAEIGRSMREAGKRSINLYNIEQERCPECNHFGEMVYQDYANCVSCQWCGATIEER